MEKRKKRLFRLLLGLVWGFGLALLLLCGCSPLRESRETEIAVFEQPEGCYTLSFRQVGEPVFPFGPTTVRLVLSDGEGKVIASAEEILYDDGANAGAGNIRSVSWQSAAVTVVLCASEMEDKEVRLCDSVKSVP